MRLLTTLVIFIFLCSCHKKENLDRKPSSAILVPTSADDFQALLDNETLFGTGTYLNVLSGDEFYFTDASANGLPSSELKTYTWQKEIFGKEESVFDWNNSYSQVFCANTVMEGIDKLLQKNSSDNLLKAIKGDAFFKRGYAFYNLAQVFALAYDPLTGTTDLGIPLRLTTDSKETLVRGSVQSTYDQIISDLLSAIELLPATIDFLHRNRSSKPAAWAMLARVYLSMRSYEKAADAAGHCLQLYDSLINYNQVSLIPFPFTATNKETLYQNKTKGNNLLPALLSGSAFVDSILLRSYKPEDLRPSIFFNNTFPLLRGSLSGEIYPFTGLSLPEIYLIMAECQARLNNKDLSLQFLNRLLINRWRTGQFIPFSANSAEEAKQLVLAERKKELLLRGQRWTDIRRLNKEGFGIELKRILNGTVYTLKPNDPKFALPIPEEVRQMGNYTQNQR